MYIHTTDNMLALNISEGSFPTNKQKKSIKRNTPHSLKKLMNPVVVDGFPVSDFFLPYVLLLLPIFDRVDELMWY
jgi:hypothetical protein